MLCESKGIRQRKQTGKLPYGINVDFFEISVKARFFLFVDLREFFSDLGSLGDGEKKIKKLRK